LCKTPAKKAFPIAENTPGQLEEVKKPGHAYRWPKKKPEILRAKHVKSETLGSTASGSFGDQHEKMSENL